MAWKEENRKHRVRSDAKFDSRTAGVVGRALAFGMTYDDIGYLLAVKGHTVQDWQQRYPQFDKAVKKAREAAKSITVAQMLRCAWGYKTEKRTEKFNVSIDEQGNEIHTDGKKVVTIVYDEVPPNGDLIKFVIQNLDKENWKDVKRIDISSRSTNLNLMGEAESEAIDALVGRLVKKIESKEIVNAKPDETGGEQPAIVLVGDTNGVVPEYSI